ncbi:hypothetical protein [Paucibacter soli]|uniref:hypothetical protein n=1 Tax=Paucibacter soli TaxID=3133433 RepID=UPI0030A4E769
MSKIESLKNHLASWMRVDTWDTLHPLDEERFHKALNACFRQFGPQISANEFEDAMLALLEQYHPTKMPIDRAERLHSWVLKAEVINSYLYDTRQLA